MQEKIRDYLAAHKHFFHESANWPNDISLIVRGYLTSDLPPNHSIVSIRAVVFRSEEVLAIRDLYQWHITPGGRREEGESFEATLRREVLEETGWQIDILKHLAVIHFQHQTSKPKNYKYPYPNFFHLVYLADALTHHPDEQEKDGYERESKFQSLSQIDQLDLSIGQQTLLDAAISARFSR